MGAFLISRLLSALIVIIGVVCLVFMLIHLVPGDPVDVMLGESAIPADREALRSSLGLDRPITVQLTDFLKGVAVLDLGDSLHTRQPVSELLASHIPATLELALAALIVTLLTAIPLGILAAVNRGGMGDWGAMGFSMLGLSIPNFWLGPLLILCFSLWLGWTPVSGREDFSSLILPAVTLGTGFAAILARMVRSSLLEVLGEDYVRTARAKGLDETRVIWRHAMRNAWLPVITLLGLQLGALLGGAVVTEVVFDWPGIGSLMIESIQKRDYPVVQGCVLFISLAYVLVNTLTDILYGLIDPRIRSGGTA
ncbi:MAG: ABC transporter permease [Candidatus Thiodiazotropha sp. (ex Lucina aurantia)]|uniref:Dipeptide transport system permease protein DppB n=2 Tax=Candidatus Thiodiazotropha TaxID=1913444 RepID=A0A7Z0VKA8_9GAMM|nr:nickel ABC transporter permease [Candidatus Thiodiazotropha endolucinida]MBT3011910.1 ABC transporter permease [Candidatus Thiodiazotropha sp. (ex Lucina pensylvanica)]MBT3023752.1 ABC transporter permease [Candidatus Thiodiazotropha taylori]MBT3041842.1 ABC transporter permease [Candidatus Thiodiazotropha sp. (ex Codakia orbicularis)]MBV2103451.1 ABC transporter permease [Candidatus Thiodiazotropha sp. (ex Lucina aurantia)]MBT3030972.1 ABC transporter permease [Candidatus Thiodiazotropha s